MLVNSFYRKNRELLLYVVFGLLTTIIGIGIYYILTIFILNPNNSIELQMANIISWIVSVLFAYVTNRLFVFRSKNKAKLKELSSFFTTRIITLFMDMVIMGFGVSIFNINDRLVKIVSQVIVIVSNYLFSKIVVFNKNKVKI